MNSMVICTCMYLASDRCKPSACSFFFFSLSLSQNHKYISSRIQYYYNLYDSYTCKYWSRLMRKPTICICETPKAQIRFAVTAKMISAFVLAIWIVQTLFFINPKGGRVGIWAPAHWSLGEIDGLLVPPGKTSNLLTDNRSSEPAQEKWLSQTIHT